MYVKVNNNTAILLGPKIKTGTIYISYVKPRTRYGHQVKAEIKLPTYNTVCFCCFLFAGWLVVFQV